MTQPDIFAELDRARRELLAERFEERAAILEFDAGLPRAEAERVARAMYGIHESGRFTEREGAGKVKR